MCWSLTTLADHQSFVGDAPGGAAPTLERGESHALKIRRRCYFLLAEISRGRLRRDVARYEPSKTIGKPTPMPIVTGSLRRMTPRAIAIAVFGYVTVEALGAPIKRRRVKKK